MTAPYSHPLSKTIKEWLQNFITSTEITVGSLWLGFVFS
jgi:hypothetical protein